jgi:hypothetical protein
MPYTPTAWVDNVTMGNQTRMNNLETQYGEAAAQVTHEMLSAGVLYGLIATKDGTTANQLDVTAGVALLTNVSDGHRRVRTMSASTPGQFTTSTPSTTYYLDLNPDGTWSWGTAHSGVTNHLTICSVTTDGSGTISTVTDARTLNFTLLPNAVHSGGVLTLPPLNAPTINGALTFAGSSPFIISTAQSGSANGLVFKTWNGSASVTPFSVGGQYNSALSFVDSNGVVTVNPASVPASTTSYYQMKVGSDSYGRASFGIRSDGSGNLRLGNSGTGYATELYTDGTSLIVSSGVIVPGITFAGTSPFAINTPSSGSAQGIKFSVWNGTALLSTLYLGGDLSSNTALSIDAVGAVHLGGTGSQAGYLITKQSGSANGFVFKTWNGSAAVTPFSIGGQYASALAWVDASGNYNGPASGGIPTTRNGTATSVPIYTGTTTPSSPPTGSIWIKA